jgi:hypothetical protein
MVMGKLAEHYKAMASIVWEEQNIEAECRQNGLEFWIVKRIAESTPWTLRESFNFCLRKKEAKDEWQDYPKIQMK